MKSKFLLLGSLLLALVVVSFKLALTTFDASDAAQQERLLSRGRASAEDIRAACLRDFLARERAGE